MACTEVDKISTDTTRLAVPLRHELLVFIVMHICERNYGIFLYNFPSVNSGLFASGAKP